MSNQFNDNLTQINRRLLILVACDPGFFNTGYPRDASYAPEIQLRRESVTPRIVVVINLVMEWGLFRTQNILHVVIICYGLFTPSKSEKDQRSKKKETNMKPWLLFSFTWCKQTFSPILS